MDTNRILLDVGGTFIKRSDGRSVHVDSNGGAAAIAAVLSAAIGPTDGISGIGVAIPGPFDYQKGVFLMKHKFASVYGKSLRELADIPQSVRLVFHHDVNALLLGCIKMLGLEEGNTALVTIGTGLGYSFAQKGQVQYSPSGSPARSLWNLPDGNGGILEDHVSARGICNEYARITGDNDQTARTIARKAYDGDRAAQKAYALAGEYLGRALAQAISGMNVSTVLTGGQVSQSFSLMEPSFMRYMEGIRLVQAPPGAVYEGLSSLF
ncbi:MAG: ROK family protein [Bacteroidales bacterium]|nr:ROK family protein [Bacteroidales bacterium]